MWQRFTERARRVILLGQQEADRMNSGHVGTEHLLIGLARENQGVAAQVLEKMGVTLDKVRQEVEALSATSPPTKVHEPKLTREAKRVLELAADEGRRMRHNYIGTEHLLLALLREKDGLGATVLGRLGLNLEKARTHVMEYLGPVATETPASPRLPASNVSAASFATTVDFQLTPGAMLLLGLAAIDVKENGESLISPRHILLAILENTDGDTAGLLETFGLDLEKAKAALRPPPQTEPHQVD